MDHTETAASAAAPAHHHNHSANIKYGWFVMLLSIAHVTYIFLSRHIYLRKWIQTGRASTYKRLVSIPDTLFVIAWSLLLLAMTFYMFDLATVNTSIKRMGRLCYALLSFDIFISLKPNPLPNVYYLELIFLHKWISRVIVLWALAHSIGYSCIWIRDNTFEKFLRILNSLGVIAMVLFLVTTVVSLKPLRRRFYNLFFTTHLIIAWAVTALIQFHARPGVTFFNFINGVMFILQIVLKIWKTKDVVVDKKTSSGSTLELITIPNYWTNQFMAGSHIRLSYPKRNVLNYLLPSHPYTIASTPEDNNIKLIVRKNKYELRSYDIVSCFGPFPSIHNNFFKTAENVLLIAGGAGISYNLGLFQRLMENPSINVTMIWIMRNKSDTWVLNHFRIKKIDIYITGGALTSDDPVSRDDDDFEDEQLLENLSSDEFEMESLDAFDESSGVSRPDKSIKFGRPQMSSYSKFITQDDRANNWVISCGTGTLNRDCKKWAEALGVRFHSESYDM